MVLPDDVVFRPARAQQFCSSGLFHRSTKHEGFQDCNHDADDDDDEDGGGGGGGGGGGDVGHDDQDVNCDDGDEEDDE